jgi:Tol biopolymer transport system component
MRRVVLRGEGNRRGRAAVITVAVASTLMVAAARPVEATPACAISEQLTAVSGGGFNGPPVVDADGSRIAFVSNQDLDGQNADHNGEVYMADVPTHSITQVTVSTGGGAGNSQVAIDDSGDRIAFISAANLTGQNPDNNDQLFLYNAPTTQLTQLTAHTSSITTVAEPDITGNGSRIVFRSDANLTGGNADGNSELFRINTSGAAGLTQLTSGSGGTLRNPSTNLTGSRIAFESDRNLVPATGNPDGNTEIFVLDPAGPTTVQLTNTPIAVGNGGPMINSGGTQVAFASQGNLAGTNADGNFEVFRRTVTNPAVAQLTDTDAGANLSPSIDASGNRIAFGSDSVDHPRATDATRNVYLADVGQPGVSPVTARHNLVHSDSPVLSDDGRVIALLSKSNPLGTNGDGSTELFVARCGSPTPSFSDVPASSASFGAVQWLTGTGIATGFPNGTFKPRDELKRQQMASILYRLAGSPPFTPPATPTFSDVPTSSPFYDEIEWMVDEGITTGFTNGTFKPKNTVKRQQVAAFLYTFAGEPLFSAPGTPSFSDVPTSSPNYLQIEWLVAEDVTDGFPNGTFGPKDPVKRQQIANITHAFAVAPGPGHG